MRCAEATIAFQQKNVGLAEMRDLRTWDDFDLGKATLRDIEEAQDELLAAQNALVKAQVDYIIATLQLKKDTGELDFDTQWRELIK